MGITSKKDTKSVRILWSELHSIDHALERIVNKGQFNDLDREKIESYIEILTSDPYSVACSSNRKSAADLAIYSAMIEEDINVTTCLLEAKPGTSPAVEIAQLKKAFQDWLQIGQDIPENMITLSQNITRGLMQRAELALFV